MTGPRVLVSAALGRTGLALVRDLGRRGFEPVGADSRAAPLGLRSRWSRPHVRLPSPGDVGRVLGDGVAGR